MRTRVRRSSEIRMGRAAESRSRRRLGEIRREYPTHSVKSMTLETTLFFHHFFNDLLAPTLLVAYVTILCTLCGYRHFVTFWTMLALVSASALSWEYVTPLYLDRSSS